MQLKARKLPLKKIQNGSFSEGDKDDDWVLVDCQTTLVHLMLPGAVVNTIKNMSNALSSTERVVNA
jgi:ribosomal silencing factor RsfS